MKGDKRPEAVKTKENFEKNCAPKYNNLKMNLQQNLYAKLTQCIAEFMAPPIAPVHLPFIDVVKSCFMVFINFVPFFLPAFLIFGVLKHVAMNTKVFNFISFFFLGVLHAIF